MRSRRSAYSLGPQLRQRSRDGHRGARDVTVCGHAARSARDGAATAAGSNNAGRSWRTPPAARRRAMARRASAVCWVCCSFRLSEIRLSRRARSVNTSTRGRQRTASVAFGRSRSDGSRQRRKGLMRRSRPSVDGSVTSSRSRSAATSAWASRTSWLSGSTAAANLQVRGRVFVAAVDLRGIGQRSQAIERIEHLGGRAFEQAAAPGAEQRVAAEERRRDRRKRYARGYARESPSRRIRARGSQVLPRRLRPAPAHRKAFFRGPARRPGPRAWRPVPGLRRRGRRDGA